jgi:hypothetical protein
MKTDYLRLRTSPAQRAALVEEARKRDVSVQHLLREAVASLTGVPNTVRRSRFPRDPEHGGWNGRADGTTGTRGRTPDTERRPAARADRTAASEAPEHANAKG